MLCCVLFRYEIRDTHLVEDSVLKTLKERADFSSFKARPFNMREFYDRTGHDIKEMLLSCYYRGAECSAEDFKVVRKLHPQVSLIPRAGIWLAGEWSYGKMLQWSQLPCSLISHRCYRFYLCSFFVHATKEALSTSCWSEKCSSPSVHIEFAQLLNRCETVAMALREDYFYSWGHIDLILR